MTREVRYRLELTEEQAYSLLDALDLYSRLGLGQFKELVRLFQRDHVCTPEALEEANHLAVRLKHTLTDLPTDGYWGVANPKVPEKYRVAYDILQVVRYYLAWTRSPKGNTMSVHFDKPQATSLKPLPTCTVHAMLVKATGPVEG